MNRRFDKGVTILVAPGELPAQQRVWGTGGWLAPEEREALDWLTLCRLLGWEVNLQPIDQWNSDQISDCIILAGDPGQLSDLSIDRLRSLLNDYPLFVVARLGTSESKFARFYGAAPKVGTISGRDLQWRGPGTTRRWNCRNSFAARALDEKSDTKTWVTLDGEPVIAAKGFGRGVVVALGFHPSRGRDVDGAVTSLLKHLLARGRQGPTAWLDLENTLVLRMDDPGGAQNIYNRDWSHSKLMESNWAQIGVDLRRRNGRLSIAYVTGWVDDADAGRGRLRVAGKIPARHPGTVYDSPTVEYVDLAGHAPGTVHDYGSEYRGIQALRQRGLADVELHGYTHMHPNSLCWAHAPQRYESVSWFRELGKPAEEYIASLPPEQHPLVKGAAALQCYFRTWPTTLICPGDQWTDHALERALDLDLKMVSSYYLAIRHHGKFCWTQHLCAPYLDESEARWLDSGLPIVGYFHDRDLALGGVGWMTQALDRWQELGVRRIVDFRELAAAIERCLHLSGTGENLTLRIAGHDAPPLVKPLLISIRSNPLPSRISVEMDGRRFSLPVHHCGNGEGRVELPCVGVTTEANIENFQA